MVQNSKTILSTIEKSTDGKCFHSQRYSYDSDPRPGIDYDDKQEINYETDGETRPPKVPKNLREEADAMASSSIFKYFLDGSRHVYKIDDISYNKNIYPLLAGQIGVCCCKREDRQISREVFVKKYVIVLPDIAGNKRELKELEMEINENPSLKGRGISFSIQSYKREGSGRENEYEDNGIAVVQDEMMKTETDTVADLVRKNKLDSENMLIKDGSIEYRDMATNKLKNNYKNVIGLSKSFNPTKCKLKNGKTSSEIIAKLKVFERTPVYMYKSGYASSSSDRVYLGIWYTRIRDAKYTHNVFDGVLKMEKVMLGDEVENGIDSDTIDTITANVLNERNPVCYGTDKRWANHIYPVYLTEQYAKSQYMSNALFEKLF